jgi:hypothetical protein
MSGYNVNLTKSTNVSCVLGTNLPKCQISKTSNEIVSMKSDFLNEMQQYLPN